MEYQQMDSFMLPDVTQQQTTSS